MPSRSKTPCSKCRTALIPVGSGGLCDTCRKNKHKEYNRFRRDQEAQSIYNSNRWRKVRNLKLQQDPLCELCRPEVVIGSTVHHIKEIKDGGDPYDMDNLQTVCAACHNKIHDKFKKRPARGGGVDSFRP